MNYFSKELKKIKNYFPELLLSIIVILFTISIFNYEKNFTTYVFVENLINYEGGFIRRGFLGSVAFFFHQTLNINPKIFFVVLYFLLYISLILIFFYLINNLKKENYYLSILIIISPATFLFLIFDNNAFFRKEIFLILVFFIHIYIAKKTLEKNISFQRYLNFNYFLIFPILILNSLIHELQFFLLLFHFLINLLVLKIFNKKNKFLKYLYIFLTLVFIVTINSGNENTVTNIENSIEIFVPNIQNDYGPTDMLNGNINLVIGSFLKMIISSNFLEFFQVFIMFFGSIVFFLIIFNKLIEKNKISIFFFKDYNNFLIIYIFVILLFLVITAFDFGRLFHIISMHIIGFYLILPNKTFKFSFKTLSQKLTFQLGILFYFMFFSMPHSHILMGKGSMYLDYGSGALNYFFENFEPLIHKILS